MLPFISGFILACLSAVAAFLLFFRKGTVETGSAQNNHRKQLEELSKLTGGLAHEIKNPLSTIKVNLKLITEDADTADPKTTRWLRKIAVVQKESDRLTQILDDFLRYISRSEPNLVPADINDVINDMIDFYSPQASINAVTIRISLCPKSLICKIDADMIKQVILNLFINAIQAMPDGGELIIRTQMIGKNATIEISDTGTGIEPQKLDKIFQAYYTSKPTGTGLGLPTARKIIEAHHGKISVNSQIGKGTSFTITIPAHIG